jgi:hypothetical protein
MLFCMHVLTPHHLERWDQLIVAGALLQLENVALMLCDMDM